MYFSLEDFQRIQNNMTIPYYLEPSIVQNIIDIDNIIEPIILENNQTSKGIKMPAVLQPYLGFDFIEK